MSTERKISVFTPPPDYASDEPSSPAIKPGPSASHNQGTEVRRKFSHEETPIPIPINTSANDLTFIDIISSSAFADVVRVQRNDTKQIVTAKAFNHSSWRSEYLCHAELRVLQSVNSPWIISFYGYIQDFTEDFLLFEYLPDGSLLNLVQKHALSEDQVRFYAAEMFLAMDSLHKCGIMHRNIQLSNFLIHKSGHLRLTGFGMSYQFGDKHEPFSAEDNKTDRDGKGKSKFKRKSLLKPKLSLITNPVFASPDKSILVSDRAEARDTANTEIEHSVGYMAPEVLRLVMPKPFFQVGKPKLGYSYLCDYWSLGVAMYRMLYGVFPFTADNKGIILDKVMKYRKTLVFPLGAVSLASSNVLKDLLKKESARLGRLGGLAEVQNHAFFQDLQWPHFGHGKVAVPARKSDLARYIATGHTTPPPENAPLEARPDPPDDFIGSHPASSSSDDLLAEQDQRFTEAMEQLTMDFLLPLCSDPTVTAHNWPHTPPPPKPSHRDERADTISQPGSLGSLVSHRLDKYTGKEEETTYLSKLLAWFNTNSPENTAEPSLNSSVMPD